MFNKAYIAKWCFWSPGKGSQEAPPLPFVSPMIKRRLSQLSCMVLYAVHEVSQGRQQVKISFSSEYGEITQQLKISEEILETQKVSTVMERLASSTTKALTAPIKPALDAL